MGKSTKTKASAEGSRGEIIVYRDDAGAMKLDVRLEGETVWLTQQSITELFLATVPNISMHIRNVFDEGELSREATHKKFLSVRREGSREVHTRVCPYTRCRAVSSLRIHRVSAYIA